MQIKYRTIDILKDEHLKEWIKVFANWPSFPMVFINGKFVGSTEIVFDLVEKDEFL